MKRGALVVATLLAATLSACGASSRAEVQNADGTVVLDVCVTVAETAAERAAGLRGQSLSEGEGLVIRFPVEGEVCIVNSGVPYAIDLVFASSDGRVLEVRGSVPANDATPYCVAGTRRVLEVLAGGATAVRVGDRLRVGV